MRLDPEPLLSLFPPPPSAAERDEDNNPILTPGSVAWIADRHQLNEKMVCRWRKGHRVALDVADRIAAAEGVPLGQLYPDDLYHDGAFCDCTMPCDCDPAALLSTR